MGDAPSENERVSNLEAEVRSLRIALEDEIRQRKQGEANAEKQIVDMGLLFQDNNDMLKEIINTA